MRVPRLIFLFSGFKVLFNEREKKAGKASDVFWVAWKVGDSVGWRLKMIAM